MTTAKKTTTRKPAPKSAPTPETHVIDDPATAYKVMQAYHTGLTLGRVEGAQNERHNLAMQGAIVTGAALLLFGGVAIYRRVRT